MASQLSDDEVRRIAQLARLDIAPDDVQKLAQQLTAILKYAELVQQVNTSGIPPTESLAPTAFREDEPDASLSRPQVLDQAPDAQPDAGLFRVPKVI